MAPASLPSTERLARYYTGIAAASDRWGCPGRMHPRPADRPNSPFATGRGGAAAYRSSTAALNALTLLYAQTLAEKGFKVNALAAEVPLDAPKLVSRFGEPWARGLSREQLIAVFLPREPETVSASDFKSGDSPLESGEQGAAAERVFHVRILQRGGRKTLTTLEGLPRGVDPQKMLKLLKKQFDCNGTIVETAEGEQVVQLQGDHREKLGEFLIEGGFAKKGEVKVHGT